MQNKSPKKLILKIILIIIIILILVSIYFGSKTRIYVNYGEAVINNPVAINIYVKKGAKYQKVENLSVDVHHKYKKDEEIVTDLTPYEDGKYQLYYYPQIQGEYLVDIEAEVNGEKIRKSTIIEVQ